MKGGTGGERGGGIGGAITVGAETTPTEMFRLELMKEVRLAMLSGPLSMRVASLTRLPVITSSSLATMPWDTGSTTPRLLEEMPSDEASAVVLIAGAATFVAESVESSSVSMTKLLESLRREAWRSVPESELEPRLTAHSPLVMPEQTVDFSAAR